MKTLKKIKQLENQMEGKIRKWNRGRLAGFGSFALGLALVLALLISDKSTTLLPPSQRPVVSWNLDSSGQSYLKPTIDTQAITERNGIPITTVRDEPVANVGISMNPEVVLTDSLVGVAKAFNTYLLAHQEFAVITSGKRTSEGQLDIIKERIAERGADSKFPRLEDATVANTKIWLRAWEWLRRRRVPVNAPAEVPGAQVRTSMHLKGLAMDFISDNLDHTRAMLADFAHSKYASAAPLHIIGIVREPGCVHINLG
jgi:hypothetical protein